MIRLGRDFAGVIAALALATPALAAGAKRIRLAKVPLKLDID